MRFVAVKTVEQQDIQAAHRIRSELIGHRTAKANQIRGLVAEYGLVAPQQLARLRSAIPAWMEDAENGLTSRFRVLLSSLWGDLTTLDHRVTELDREINTIAQSDPVAMRLQQLRGVGPMVATALVAAVGNAEQFANGRQMSASLGLTPKQHSSGGKDRLLSISKRGDAYLRSILIHGARSVIRTAKLKDGFADSLGIIGIVLVALYVGLYKLRGNQLHGNAFRLQLTCPVVCSRASLHTNLATWLYFFQ